MFFGDAHPRAEMDFVDGVRGTKRVALVPLLHPLLIVPFVVEVPYDRDRARRFFEKQAHGIGFVDAVSVAIGLDMELIQIAVICTLGETFPDAGRTARTKAVRFRVPSVETSH